MTSEEEIINKYVWNANIYGALMSGNIVTDIYSEEERLLKTQSIQKMVYEGTDELIEQLLAIENWRARLVGGCLIGFKNRKKYKHQIGERLLKGCGGVTGYCYSLGRFADKESVNYLTKYLNKSLQFDRFPDEKFQDWAFIALRWIDKINGTTISNDYLKEDGLWNKFVNFEFKTKKTWKLSDSKKWGDLESRDNDFERIMNYYKENFEEK